MGQSTFRDQLLGLLQGAGERARSGLQTAREVGGAVLQSPSFRESVPISPTIPLTLSDIDALRARGLGGAGEAVGQRAGRAGESAGEIAGDVVTLAVEGQEGLNRRVAEGGAPTSPQTVPTEEAIRENMRAFINQNFLTGDNVVDETAPEFGGAPGAQAGAGTAAGTATAPPGETAEERNFRLTGLRPPTRLENQAAEALSRRVLERGGGSVTARQALAREKQAKSDEQIRQEQRAANLERVVEPERVAGEAKVEAAQVEAQGRLIGEAISGAVTTDELGAKRFDPGAFDEIARKSGLKETEALDVAENISAGVQAANFIKENPNDPRAEAVRQAMVDRLGEEIANQLLS